MKYLLCFTYALFICVSWLNAKDIGEKVVVLEGIVKWGKGVYLYEDGINGNEIAGIAAFPDTAKYKNKKVQLLGFIVKNSDSDRPLHVELYQDVPYKYTFHVLKVLSVEESKYQEDISCLAQIFKNKKIKAVWKDESLRNLIDQINAKYEKTKITVEPQELQDSLKIAYFNEPECTVSDLELIRK